MAYIELARNIWLNYEGRRPQPENAYGESERLGLILSMHHNEPNIHLLTHIVYLRLDHG